MIDAVQNHCTYSYHLVGRGRAFPEAVIPHTDVDDSIGNSVHASRNAETNLYAANALNQYTAILRDTEPPCEPTYDADGNLTAWNGTALEWDPENRLYYGWGGSDFGFIRDWSGRAFSETEGPDYTDRVFDGWNPVFERTFDGWTGEPVSDTVYVWGADLSGSLQGAGGVGGLLAVRLNGTWHVPLYDANGHQKSAKPKGNPLGDRDFIAVPKGRSEERYPATQRQLYVTAYVSESGEVVAEYEYDAFGNTISQSGSLSDTFRHRFSTKPWIAALGVYDYGERLYSPELRRWLSRDPIEENGGLNLYAMCGNDPLDKFDSLGFFISCRQNGEIRIAENQKWKLVKLDYMKDATHSAFVVALTRIVAVWELEGKVKCCCSILGFIPWNRTVPVKKKITVEIPLEPVVIAHNATSVPVPVTFPFSGMSAVGAVLGISGEAVLNKFFTLMVFDDRTDIPRIAEEVASSAPSSIEKGEWPRKPCD